MAGLKDSIAADARHWRALGYPRLIHEIVAKHGVDMPVRPHRLPMEQPRECFRNATLLAMRDESLRYAEGFGWRTSFAMPVHHAWCVDGDGFVVDTTWTASADDCYVGIAFDLDVLCEALERKEFYGLLTDGDTVNLHILKHLDAALVDEVMALAASPERAMRNLAL